MTEFLKKICPVILAVLLFTPLQGRPQEPGEQALLEEQQKQLQKKRDTLRQEQDFLRFQKGFYVSDSKYLLLDFVKEAGQLKYKNRVLKSFKFTPAFKISSQTIQPGAVALTRKIQTSGGWRSLTFGAALVIQMKSKAARREDRRVPRIAVSRSDMASLFYALEEGSRAYVVR